MRIEESIEICAPGTVVHRHLVEPHLVRSWSKALRSIRIDNESRTWEVIGTKFSFKAHGKQYDGQVLKSTPGARQVLCYESQAAKFTHDYRITELRGISTLTAAVHGEFNGVIRTIIGALCSNLYKMALKQDLERLMNAAERFERRR